jgi:hypothetical protein
MNKKCLKKMVLSKETLRRLTEVGRADLEKAAGAALPNSDFQSCQCHTVSCKPGFC